MPVAITGIAMLLIVAYFVLEKIGGPRPDQVEIAVDSTPISR
jgi:hypothetical protein